MNVLIVGCGYVGSALAEQLLAQGHPVHAIVRQAQNFQPTPALQDLTLHSCDLTDLPALRSLASELPTLSHVVHCASTSGNSNPDKATLYREIYLQPLQELINLFPKAHLLYTSSTSVYPQENGEWVDEKSPAEPNTATGKVLRQAEDCLLEHGGTVARLAGLYGPHRSYVLKKLLNGTAVIEGHGGEGKLINQIHRHDAASAIAHLLQHNLRGIYNLCDHEPIGQKECFGQVQGLLLDAHGISISDPPYIEPNEATKKARKRGWSHKKISIEKLRGTGWEAKYPSYLEALRQDEALVPSILAQVGEGGK